MTLFNKKYKTPMQFFKKELTQLKEIGYLSFVELNRKEYKNIFFRTTMLTSKAVTFDYFILFNLSFNGTYRNEKGDLRYNQNFGFAINYKNSEPEIRASLKFNKESGAEYSRNYSVEEFKTLILKFIDNIDKNDTLKIFKEIFDITVSSEISVAEVKKTQDNFIKTLKALNGNKKVLQHKRDCLVNSISKNKNYDSYDRNKMIEELETINDDLSLLEKNKIKQFKDDSKNMPYIIRKFFSKQFNNGNL